LVGTKYKLDSLKYKCTYVLHSIVVMIVESLANYYSDIPIDEATIYIRTYSLPIWNMDICISYVRMVRMAIMLMNAVQYPITP